MKSIKPICILCVDPEKKCYEWDLSDETLYGRHTNLCPLVILANPEWEQTGGPITGDPNEVPGELPWPPEGCHYSKELKALDNPKESDQTKKTLGPMCIDEVMKKQILLLMALNAWRKKGNEISMGVDEFCLGVIDSDGEKDWAILYSGSASLIQAITIIREPFQPVFYDIDWHPQIRPISDKKPSTITFGLWTRKHLIDCPCHECEQQRSFTTIYQWSNDYLLRGLIRQAAGPLVTLGWGGGAAYNEVEKAMSKSGLLAELIKRLDRLEDKGDK